MTRAILAFLLIGCASLLARADMTTNSVPTINSAPTVMTNAVVAPTTNAAPTAVTNAATTKGLVLVNVKQAPGGDEVLPTTAPPPPYTGPFPRPLDTYNDSGSADVGTVLVGRACADPFNITATVIFLLAVIHTFLAPKILAWSNSLQDDYELRVAALHNIDIKDMPQHLRQSIPAAILHFLGEVEVVFGIWAIPLGIAMIISKGMDVTRHYFDRDVSYIEPLFVVVIMAIAASRPVVNAAIWALDKVAGDSPVAWWWALLTVGPLLGSFITEPAAMTICALLLGREFYRLNPSPVFMYATLGLLFVNISVGGALTTFAAPPVLIVAAKWNWTTLFMLEQFGWKIVVGILVSNLVYFLIFRKEFTQLLAARVAAPAEDDDGLEPVPLWVTLVHFFFLAFTVVVAHEPALFIGGFLFFLAFVTATAAYQLEINMRSPMLVGFFLAGLVIHGTLQGWWIEPVLGRLGELPLLFGAAALTAFNDNAAITYLATLVPNFSDHLKIAVMSGAIAGGGLTVIANAPNPAGQSLLRNYFPDGIAPGKLLLAALFPTAVMLALFCVPR